MIKVEHIETYGWEAAVRGLRNPMNSWEKSDSKFPVEFDLDIDGNPIMSSGKTICVIGENDLSLMKKLVSAGTDHSKFMRMIGVSVDITAPLYWWKEFDTYKVGTVANSCSTMHTIHKKPFELNDFSWDELLNTGCDLFVREWDKGLFKQTVQPLHFLADYIIPSLNVCREKYLETQDKKYWWQMIQLLPSSYNQKRTVTMNYAVLRNMYHARKDHKLSEWRDFCKIMEEKLPYSELITM